LTQRLVAQRFKPKVRTFKRNHFPLISSLSCFDSQPNIAQVPVLAFVEKWNNLLNIDNGTMSMLRQYSDSCGYTSYYNKYLAFPPAGPFPQPQSPEGDCALWDFVYQAAVTFNPCFDMYQIATTCPLLWDVLGFPGSFPYQPDGATIYFNRSDVQKAINAPIQEWAECSSGVLTTDSSPLSAWSVLPSVIERSNRTLLVHGNLDFIFIADGALLVVQNMTWGGKQGFQQKPSDDFFVPARTEIGNFGSLGGSGIMGITHTERKFTWVETFLSGHMVSSNAEIQQPARFNSSNQGPQYQPSATFRQLEYLLGRVDNLTTTAGFTA
jgi:carboxypeptidase D